MSCTEIRSAGFLRLDPANAEANTSSASSCGRGRKPAGAAEYGELPPAFQDSGRVRAWPAALPVATPCAVIDKSWAGEGSVPAVPNAAAVPATNDAAGLYLDLVGRCMTNWLYPEVEALVPPHQRFDASKRMIGTDWPPTAHTMIGVKRVANLRRCCETAIRENVPGDFLEAGVWRGGAGVLMRAVLAALGDRERKVWLADSFRGLPPPDPMKYPLDAGLNLHEHAYLSVGVDRVRAVFELYGLLDERVQFLEGGSATRCRPRRSRNWRCCGWTATCTSRRWTGS